MPALLASLLAWALLAVPAPPEPPAIAPGRYVIHVRARIHTDRLGSHERALDVLALVAPGSAPGDVRIYLRAQGQECELRARRARDGELVLPTGQTCRLALDSSDARGSFDARLTAGSGHLREGELALRLAFQIAGTLRKRLAIPGAEELGEAWTPELPLRGDVEGVGRGREERAR